jgi:hypothetical protein
VNFIALFVVLLASVALVGVVIFAPEDGASQRVYRCAAPGKMMDYGPEHSGILAFHLINSDPGEATDSWSVRYPEKQAISAESFRADTRSIGGSLGLQWVEPDGAPVLAFLSFSDIIGIDGPETVWVQLKATNVTRNFGMNLVPAPDLNDPTFERFTCGPA